MRPDLGGNASFFVTSILVLACCTRCFADDAEYTHQLSLADLTQYRAALTRKPAADGAKTSDPAMPVNFLDLWNRPQAFRGRRVMIEGRVQRIFRQGPVGDFPALAEIWIASSASDPFCLVVPQGSSTASLSVNDHGQDGRATSRPMPKRGQKVRFTGTFLKTVRYSARDGTRLAPLLVGDEPPLPLREASKANGTGLFSTDHLLRQLASSPGGWLLGLILLLLAGGLLARRHLRLPSQQIERRNQHRGMTVPLRSDPPLEFVEPHHEP